MTASFDEKNMAKSRAVCAEMAEAASTGKRVLTERERQILDIWPKFEDGEYVWFEDEVKADPIFGGGTGAAHVIEFMSFTYILKNNIGERIAQDRFQTRVRRPAPKVLDSWERLESDARKAECGYFGINGLATKTCLKCPKYDPDVSCDRAVRFDIIRRAKALAEVEVD